MNQIFFSKLTYYTMPQFINIKLIHKIKNFYIIYINLGNFNKTTN